MQIKQIETAIDLTIDNEYRIVCAKEGCNKTYIDIFHAEHHSRNKHNLPTGTRTKVKCLQCENPIEGDQVNDHINNHKDERKENLIRQMNIILPNKRDTPYGPYDLLSQAAMEIYIRNLIMNDKREIAYIGPRASIYLNNNNKHALFKEIQLHNLVGWKLAIWLIHWNGNHWAVYLANKNTRQSIILDSANSLTINQEFLMKRNMDSILNTASEEF